MNSLKYLITIFIFCSNTFAQNISVGSINLTPSVGNLGNAQLNTTIYCPQGRLGIKPNISISYNSLQTNAELGLGYSLSGISTITRSGSNFHLDNKKQATVTLTSTDNLMIDGERLILVSGTHFTANSTYRTENDKFIKITFTGNHFIVDTKDGGKLIYGSTLDAQFKPHNSSQILSWYISYSFDRMGNYIKYIYDNTNGEINISSIHYTGFDCTFASTVNCNIQQELPFHSIVFQYTNAIYNEEKMIAGYPIYKRKILDKIAVFSETTKIRDYEFTYITNNTHNLLQKIKEKNEHGETLPEINITWQEDGGYVVDRGLIRTAFDYYRATGDFDGDGVAELITIGGELNQKNNKLLGMGSPVKILKYKKNNTVNNLGFFSLQLASFNLPVDNIAEIVIADLNADGTDDLLIQQRSAFQTRSSRDDGGLLCSAYDKYYLDWITYQYHAIFFQKHDDGTVTHSIKLDYFRHRTFTHPQGGLHLSSFDQLYLYMYVTPYLADMDGDGLPDLILRQSIGSRITVSGCEGGQIQVTTVDVDNTNLFNIRLSTRRNLPNENDKYIHATLPKTTFYITDINGNGRAELFNIIHGNTTSEAYEFDVISGTWQHIYGAGGSASFPTIHHKWLQFADFNGDGKTDLLYFVGSSWYVAYSNGNYFIEHNASQFWFWHGYNLDYCKQGFHFQIGDFNGDGKADILEKHNHNHASNVDHGGDAMYIYYSIGNGFKKLYIDVNPRNSTGDRYYDSKNIIADFDGDGKSDVLLGQFLSSIQLQNFALETIKYRNYKLTEVHLTDKHSYTFSYDFLPKTTHYSNKRNGLQLLSMARLINLPLALVTEMREKTAGYRDEVLKYHYQNLLYHTHGRGMMGFQKIASVHIDDPLINKTTIQTFAQNYERLHILNISSVELFNNTTNLIKPFSNATQPISKTIYEYTQKLTTANSKIIFIHLSSQIDIDYIKGLKKTTCYEYDINGNLIQTASIYAKTHPNEIEEFIESTDNKYDKFGTWIPSSLTITRNSKLRYNGQPAYDSQKEYTYNNKGLLIHNEIFKNTPHYYLKEVFTYDIYGNLTSKGYDIANNTSPDLLRRTQYYYNSGRFLSSVANMLGHVIEYIYEPKYGNLIYTKSSDGLEVTKQYDGWGRLIQTNSPGNNIETKQIQYENTLPGAYTKQIVSNNLGNETTVYFDAKGRKIESRNKGFNGMVQVQKWNYNARGFLASETNVYNIQLPSGITTNHYQYDNYGRLLKLDYNNQFDAITYSYNLLQTTETHSSGEIKTTIIDATGAISHSVDNGGTIGYKYASHNKPVQIITPTGHQNIRIKYNDQLQKIEMIDPNSGTSLYDYNAFGEIISQQDALGNISEFEYDILGRVIKKENGQYTFEYVYHNQNGHANNNKLTVEICKHNGSPKHRIQYEYNSNGLLSQTTETIIATSKIAVTSYAYDSYHRIIGTSYPNITLQYLYDGYNNMVEIKKHTGASLWSLASVTPQGLPTQISYGNGYNTHYNFDLHGKLTGILSHNGSSNAINMSYNFNLQTGNLTSRTYNQLQLSEEFTYDNLNRLTGITKRETQIYPGILDIATTAYHADGNISTIVNGLPQSLTYSNPKPNAVRVHKFADTYSPVFIPQGSTDEHTYSYNELGMPMELNQQTLKYTIKYGLGEQRIHTRLEENNSLLFETHYLNSANMEIRGNTELTYLYAGGTPFGVHVKQGENEYMYYLHLDYLNSILAITNQQGTIVEKRDYDAWGRPRNPNTLVYSTTNPFNVSTITNRGYTFHEHLHEFSLINMNARMYDPVLRRTVSPDNYIQAPDNTQSFNRYSYCWNNPLKYTDPSGDIVVESIIMAAMIGGMINATSQSMLGNINSTLDFAKAFGIGALAGAGGALTGGAVAGAVGVGGFIGGAVAGAAGGATGGFIAGAGNSWAQGGSFKDVIRSGIVGAGIGAAGGAIIGGTVAGVQSSINNKTFWTGTAKPIIIKSPVNNNFGNENGECVLRCFEEFSESYGDKGLNYSEWFKLNESKLGVDFDNVVPLANKSGKFSSTKIRPDVETMMRSMSENKRLMIVMNTENSGHAAMVNKIKYWPDSGKYRVWISETSPIRIFPYSTSNLFDLPGRQVFTFFPIQY